MSVPPTVLTIAGTDPCGGAGIQADLRVFAALGVAGASVVTEAIAQNTTGVLAIHHLPPRFVARQIDAVARDLPVAAVKIGALGTAHTVSVVAERIRRRSLPDVVLDPVLAAKDGTPLLAARGVARLKEDLLPRALVVTPNVPEAIALTGIHVSDVESAARAAKALVGMGAGCAIVKGGHLADEAEPVDVLFDGDNVTLLRGERQAGSPVRGTGCIFSAALTSYLALGDGVPEAARKAKAFTSHAIETAVAIGKGARVWLGS